jgi:hypothetical protein
MSLTLGHLTFGQRMALPSGGSLFQTGVCYDGSPSTATVEEI